jgi:hypothetical protein
VLTFPHKTGPLTPQQMLGNYKEMERWVAVVLGDEICLCAGCVELDDGEPTGAPPVQQNCLLHVPHKEWREDEGWAKDQQNLAAIERWAAYFVRNCGCDIPEVEIIDL